MDVKDFNRLPGWVAALLVMGLVALVGLFRFDVDAQITYQPARIVAVDPVLDRPTDRMVTILIDGVERTLRVSDPRIKTTFGQTLCVKSTRRLMRGGRRYAPDLAFYCRKKARLQSALAATAEAAYL